MRSWGSPLTVAGPPLTYSEWVEAAGRFPNQDCVWRFHETFARKSGWACDDAERERLELGGEA